MFGVVVKASWVKEVKHLNLTGMNEIYGSYPIIRKDFFIDLKNNLDHYKHYWAEGGLKSVILGNKPYLPEDWLLILATDFKDRPFQILFSRTYSLGGNGTIIAVGPPDYAEFMKQMGKSSIQPTLALINSPEKMKSVAVMVTSPHEEKVVKKALEPSAELKRFKHWVDQLKATPNKEGQWFPTHEPICPVCNEKMVGIADYRVGFVKMICPRCGAEINKKL
ncbi:MAG: hypothetical protein ACTSU2_14345 [Promethearchaeota archaeon]